MFSMNIQFKRSHKISRPRFANSLIVICRTLHTARALSIAVGIDAVVLGGSMENMWYSDSDIQKSHQLHESRRKFDRTFRFSAHGPLLLDMPLIDDITQI